MPGGTLFSNRTRTRLTRPIVNSNQKMNTIVINQEKTTGQSTKTKRETRLIVVALCDRRITLFLWQLDPVQSYGHRSSVDWPLCVACYAGRCHVCVVQSRWPCTSGVAHVSKKRRESVVHFTDSRVDTFCGMKTASQRVRRPTSSFSPTVSLKRSWPRLF
jgi:hypothetical protein